VQIPVVVRTTAAFDHFRRSICHLPALRETRHDHPHVKSISDARPPSAHYADSDAGEFPNQRAHYPNPQLNPNTNPKQDNLCEELARTAQSLPGHQLTS
jgi:hypothetical protein